MKTPIIICFIIIMISWDRTNAQDGSDILYLKTAKLDKSFIGDFMHLDFYRESLFGNHIDTVNIEINGQKILFLEKRKDDGFNNWFDEQYLESLNNYSGITLQIKKSRLDSISKDSIYVTNFLEYYDNNKSIVNSRLVKSSFSRNIINCLLIDLKFHERK